MMCILFASFRRTKISTLWVGTSSRNVINWRCNFFWSRRSDSGWRARCMSWNRRSRLSWRTCISKALIKGLQGHCAAKTWIARILELRVSHSPSSFSLRPSTPRYCTKPTFDVSAMRRYEVKGICPLVNKVTARTQDNASGHRVNENRRNSYERRTGWMEETMTLEKMFRFDLHNFRRLRLYRWSSFCRSGGISNWQTSRIGW